VSGTLPRTSLPGASLPPVVLAPPPAERRLLAFVRLGRPKFLVQSLMVVGLGVTMAVRDGHPFRPGWFLLTLGFAWCTHLMTHYCNEYFDLEADRANAAPTSWTGGSRVLVSGQLSPEVSLSAAFVLAFVALGLIALMPGTEARLTAAAIAALAWFYTAPPLRLNYRALGELACAVVLYGLGPLLACLLQADRLTADDVVGAGLVCTLQFLRMSVMNLSDIDGDRATGKRTLAVALGERRLVAVYCLGQLLAPAALLTAWALGGALLPDLLAVAVTAPVAVWVARELLLGRLRDPARANAITFRASMHMPLTACALTLALLGDALTGPHGVPVSWLAVYGVALAGFWTWLARAVRANGVAAHGAPADPPTTQENPR
jgi:1,4-dihydroxy-2-naphthoate octaprenyltransferase